VAIATINPATGETVKTYNEMSEADVERRLTAAATAYEGYRLTSFAERAEWMRGAAKILDAEQDQIVAMMTTEMGKTLTRRVVCDGHRRSEELYVQGIREFCNIKSVWLG
jgi:succinate-semialdehyde dehydrogenase / glutarate-semialdehyde dehydrogenase